MEWLESFNHWVWFGVGLVLLALEVFVSGFIIMWLGFAALGVGIIKFFYPPLTWEWSLILFSLASMVSIFIWFKIFKPFNNKEGQDKLNSRGLSLVGRVAPLTRAIEGGRGRVNIDDTIWRVHGPEAPKGTMVRVVRSGGNELEVEVV